MTYLDEQRDIETLEAEFEPFEVWTDLRSRDDGARHWHARQPGWNVQQIISAYDAADMRDQLITWKRRNADAGAGHGAAT